MIKFKELNHLNVEKERNIETNTRENFLSLKLIDRVQETLQIKN